MASTALGLIRPDGREPALKARTRWPPWMWAKASAIWLRFEFSTQTKRMRGWVEVIVRAPAGRGGSNSLSPAHTGKLPRCRARQGLLPEELGVVSPAVAKANRHRYLFQAVNWVDVAAPETAIGPGQGIVETNH